MLYPGPHPHRWQSRANILKIKCAKLLILFSPSFNFARFIFKIGPLSAIMKQPDEHVTPIRGSHIGFFLAPPPPTPNISSKPKEQYS